jgi:menaquinone-dependent protoporphyrinogen IX oxidase
MNKNGYPLIFSLSRTTIIIRRKRRGKMSKKVLIVYGTRYGATQGTSEEIAKVLRDEGLDVIVVNAKNEKVKDISGYDLIIVGNGMQMARWTGAAESFLNKFQKELANKKVAIFVSSGAQALIEYQKKTEEIEKARKQYLEDKAAKYNLHPISMVIFGGVWDYNKMFILFRKTLASFKPIIEAAGYKETKSGLYDTRNWDAIRTWARELAAKIK